jgi:hypothetical protein
VLFCLGMYTLYSAPRTHKWLRVAYYPVYISKGILPCIGLSTVRLSVYTEIVQASADRCFGNPRAWSIQEGLPTIMRLSCTVLFWNIWHT